MNRQSKKDRKHNDKKEEDKRTHNNLQNTTQKANDRAIRITLNTRGDLR